jgi:hypothetical protein
VVYTDAYLGYDGLGCRGVGLEGAKGGVGHIHRYRGGGLGMNAVT